MQGWSVLAHGRGARDILLCGVKITVVDTTMALNGTGGSAHQQVKLCKDERIEHLVLGVIAPGLPSASQELVPVGRKRGHPIMINQRGYVAEDDDLDDLIINANEKKRRLTVDQVNYLEMSFNMDLKLEPERKALIAKHLGLRPRQVAIWFQNRRARWKNKQLEQDYEALKASYDAVMHENETMVKNNQAMYEENKKLQAQVAHLTRMLDHYVPRNVDSRGMSRGLDSDSDSESALKVGELLSNNLELASPTKSDAQSGTLDSVEGSCQTPHEGIVAFVDQPTGKINSFVACAAVKFEADHAAVKVEADDRLLPPSDEVFVSFPQVVNGFYVDDLLFSYQDHLFGFTWGG